MSNLKLGMRSILKSPFVSTVAIVSLALGIGANTAIFSLADQALLRALPVHEPDRVVQLAWDGDFVGGGRGWGDLMPHTLLTELAPEQQVFQSMAARNPGRVTVVTDGRSEEHATFDGHRGVACDDV